MEIGLRWEGEVKSKHSALSVEGDQQWTPATRRAGIVIFSAYSLFFYIFNGYVKVKLADWLAFAGNFLVRTS